MNVHSRFIHSSRKLETMGVSVKRRMDKDLVYSYNGILLSNKMNELLLQTTTWVTEKHYVRQKEPDTKEYILYDSISMEFQDRPKDKHGDKRLPLESEVGS